MSIFTKGNNLSDFLFASQDEETIQKQGQLLKERICSCRSKFFPLRADPFEKGDKNQSVAVASPASEPFTKYPKYLGMVTNFFKIYKQADYIMK